MGREDESNVNLRTELTKIIRNAGIEPWGKLYQTLRRSSQTKLGEKYPMRVVRVWIDNSKAVA